MGKSLVKKDTSAIFDPKKSLPTNIKSNIDWSNPKNCDRLVFVILNMVRNVPTKKLAIASGLSESYLYSLKRGPKYGGARWPRAYTMRRILGAVGKTIGDAEKAAVKLGAVLDRVDRQPEALRVAAPKKQKQKRIGQAVAAKALPQKGHDDTSKVISFPVGGSVRAAAPGE